MTAPSPTGALTAGGGGGGFEGGGSGGGGGKGGGVRSVDTSRRRRERGADVVPAHRTIRLAPRVYEVPTLGQLW